MDENNEEDNYYLIKHSCKNTYGYKNKNNGMDFNGRKKLAFNQGLSLVKGLSAVCFFQWRNKNRPQAP